MDWANIFCWAFGLGIAGLVFTLAAILIFAIIISLED